MSSFPPQRGSTAVTLVLSIAVLGAGVLAWLRPWSQSLATEESLRAAIAEYAQARKAGDMPKLFDLAAPGEADKVGFDGFAKFYGQNMTLVHGVTIESLHMDAATATTQLDIDYELVPERMPASYRRNLKVPEGSLRQHGKIQLDWLFVEGQWHYRLDRVVLTGRDSEGRRAAPADPGK